MTGTYHSWSLDNVKCPLSFLPGWNMVFKYYLESLRLKVKKKKLHKEQRDD